MVERRTGLAVQNLTAVSVGCPQSGRAGEGDGTSGVGGSGWRYCSRLQALAHSVHCIRRSRSGSLAPRFGRKRLCARNLGHVAPPQSRSLRNPNSARAPDRCADTWRCTAASSARWTQAPARTRRQRSSAATPSLSALRPCQVLCRCRIPGPSAVMITHPSGRDEWRDAGPGKIVGRSSISSAISYQGSARTGVGGRVNRRRTAGSAFVRCITSAPARGGTRFLHRWSGACACQCAFSAIREF